MFGPEMWVRECHSGDACSAPISVDGQNRYFLSMFSLDQNDLPYDILLSLLMTMKYSVENYLKMIEYWKVCNIISEDIPAAIFWVNRDAPCATPMTGPVCAWMRGPVWKMSS